MIATSLPPYVDGWFDSIGRETTVLPRVLFPFKNNPISDTYSRLYEREYEVFPGSMPRIAARTEWENLITHSESFDNAAWAKTNLTVSANDTTAPDGLVTMDKLLETTANGEHSVSQAATVTAAPHEVSFFVKGGLTRTWIRASFTDSAATVFSAFFSTSGYIQGASAGTTAKIAGMGNGHFYCVLRFTPAAGGGNLKINTSTDGATISFAGSTSAGVHIWGAQVALGTSAPYISTTSAARSILAPDRDPRDPMAFLLWEGDPEPINSNRVRVVRRFGRIPQVQTIPGSRSIPKPGIAGTFPRVINGTLVDQPDADTPEYTFFSQIAVTADSGPPGVIPSGGTYTLTFDGDTTASIAWDATAGAVQTALNLLASITAYGGVTVTGSHTAGFTVMFSYATGSVNAASITSTYGTATTSVTPTNNGLTQAVQITPIWDSPNFSAASSFTPAESNPMLVQTYSGLSTDQIVFFIGRPTAAGDEPTAGTFTLTLYGQTTAAIAYDATMADIQTAINLLSEVNDRGGYTLNPVSYGSFPDLRGFGGRLPTAAFSGGTFTLTLFGETTGAIAYNASAATIETAVDLLSEVTARGGVTVSGAGFASNKQSFTITFADIPALTSTSSITPSGTAISITQSASQGSSKTISFTVSSGSVRLLTAYNHGLDDTDDIVVTLAGTTYPLVPGNFSTPDANTVALNVSSGIVDAAGTATAVGKDNGQRYAADSPEIPIKLISTYYLPGVSPDITTADDIPIPDRGTPSQLLGAIFGGSTLFNYQVGELAQWDETPVHSITLTTLNPQHLVSPDAI